MPTAVSAAPKSHIAPVAPPQDAVLPSEAQRYRVWATEPERFSTSKISTIQHNFHEHPALQLPELAKLAHRLMPSGQCRFVTPGLTQASEFMHAPEASDGSGIDDVFRRIERPGAWVALYNVETDPQYRLLLDQVQASVRPLVETEQPDIFNVGGFIFISAPPSVTPFHIDRENNFWLQVRGRKTINVWDHTDRDVTAAADVEEFVLYGSLERIRLRDSFRARSHELDTGPGDGVYFPSTSPHMTRSDSSWVTPGDGVCVSIGTVFYSDVTRRHARVHQINQVLRRLGVTPLAPGESPAMDAFKAPFGRLLGSVRYRWRGIASPPPGCF
jgi:hypothetical protein